MTVTRRDFLNQTAIAASSLLLSRASRDEFHHIPKTHDLCSELFCDQDGLIVHRGLGPDHRDGGDTAQREGWYWFGVWIRQNKLNDPWNVSRRLTFPEVIRLLEPDSDGVFYRHPKLAPWNNPYDKQWGFSRDQMIPLVAAMGVWGMTTELRRLWNALPQDPVGGTKHTFNGQWETRWAENNLYGRRRKRGDDQSFPSRLERKPNGSG